jgi:RNA polymerase sigma factor (sigma-70 family)
MTEEQQLIERALDGDRKSREQLVKYVTPVIQARAARLLWRYRGADGATRSDVFDATQDVLARLFAAGGKALRDWDPARGLSLRNFVGLIATRHMLDTLKSKHELPASEAEEGDLASTSSSNLVESRILEGDLLEKLCLRLRQQLTPFGFEVFERLYLREQAVPEIEEELGLSADAVYQWRARLRKLARALVRQLEEGPSCAGDALQPEVAHDR